MHLSVINPKGKGTTFLIRLIVNQLESFANKNLRALDKRALRDLYLTSRLEINISKRRI